jgi:hypothetical protein
MLQLLLLLPPSSITCQQLLRVSVLCNQAYRDLQEVQKLP